MQHVSECFFMLVRLIGFIFHIFSIHEKVRTLSVVSCPYQLSKYCPIQRILIMNGMKYFYFMSFFSQAFCY